MLKDMLKKANVKVVQQVADWQEAIHKSTQMLIDSGYVTPQYAEAIINETNRLGPYYVLTPEVALPHARPEKGVLKKQLAALLVKNGVTFRKNEVPVKVFIVLAATDSSSHLSALQELSGLLMDQSKVKRLVTCDTADELYKLIVE